MEFTSEGSVKAQHYKC